MILYITHTKIYIVVIFDYDMLFIQTDNHFMKVFKMFTYLPTLSERKNHMRFLSSCSSVPVILFSEIPENILNLYYEMLGPYEADLGENAAFSRLVIEKYGCCIFHKKCGVVSITACFCRLASENIILKNNNLPPLKYGDKIVKIYEETF